MILTRGRLAGVAISSAVGTAIPVVTGVTAFSYLNVILTFVLLMLLLTGRLVPAHIAERQKERERTPEEKEALRLAWEELNDIDESYEIPVPPDESAKEQGGRHGNLCSCQACWQDREQKVREIEARRAKERERPSRDDLCYRCQAPYEVHRYYTHKFRNQDDEIVGAFSVPPPIFDQSDEQEKIRAINEHGEVVGEYLTIDEARAALGILYSPTPLTEEQAWELRERFKNGSYSREHIVLPFEGARIRDTSQGAECDPIARPRRRSTRDSGPR